MLDVLARLYLGYLYGSERALRRLASLANKFPLQRAGRSAQKALTHRNAAPEWRGEKSLIAAVRNQYEANSKSSCIEHSEYETIPQSFEAL